MSNFSFNDITLCVPSIGEILTDESGVFKFPTLKRLSRVVRVGGLDIGKLFAEKLPCVEMWWVTIDVIPEHYADVVNAITYYLASVRSAEAVELYIPNKYADSILPNISRSEVLSRLNDKVLCLVEAANCV
ncbi:MAG: hypothetical protein NC548_28595 [Lachnospiraceae bacterium]|nr:hypothetical protein [Lachnospiraceae bacterium]